MLIIINQQHNRGQKKSYEKMDIQTADLASFSSSLTTTLAATAFGEEDT
jgi:hypothetical protein